MSAPNFKTGSPEESPLALSLLSSPPVECESATSEDSTSTSADEDESVYEVAGNIPSSFKCAFRYTSYPLCHFGPVDWFTIAAQHPVYSTVNELQEQPHNGFHTAWPTTQMHEQQMPMPQMPKMSQMPQTPPMPPNSQAPAAYRDFAYERMLTEIHSFSHRLDSFNQHVGNFSRDVSHFMYDLTQLANGMNVRLVEAEHERDQLQASFAHHQPSTTTPVPQTAPEFGSRNSRFRDGDENMSMSSPVTPTRPPPLEPNQFSAPTKNSEETAFGSKLTSKKQRSEKTRARKNLQIKVPSQTSPGRPTPAAKSAFVRSNSMVSASASTSAPSTGTMPAFPPSTGTISAFTPLTGAFSPSPLTPGRVGPERQPLRATNFVNKRKIHNLEKLLPASTALIPLLPLTDTEIIVYFFQSLSRPIVSLRLYSRNWGPANIADTLNAHRTIEGGYLRNTASVKCTTAIKKGKERHGDEWAETLRSVFLTADDIHATDMMQLTEEEVKVATDFEIAALNMQLKKHPRVGVDGGIFTRCVKYCVEHNAKYMLSNVHELAILLRSGELVDSPHDEVACEDAGEHAGAEA